MVQYEASVTDGHFKVAYFDNAHAAQVFVEHIGNGRVVKIVDNRTTALWTFNASRVWEARSIFGGTSEVLGFVSPTGEVLA
jgi:hypothetical protein